MTNFRNSIGVMKVGGPNVVERAVRGIAHHINGLYTGLSAIGMDWADKGKVRHLQIICRDGIIETNNEFFEKGLIKLESWLYFYRRGSMTSKVENIGDFEGGYPGATSFSDRFLLNGGGITVNKKLDHFVVEGINKKTVREQRIVVDDQSLMEAFELFDDEASKF